MSSLSKIPQIFWLFSLWSASVLATTVFPESPNSLTKKSRIVVYGKVVQIDVDSATGFRTAIVESIETARAPREFRRQRDFYIPLLNRAIPHSDDVEFVFSAPELRLLEEVVVFLKPVAIDDEGAHHRSDGKRLFNLEGFYQGKLRVIEDTKGVRRVLAWNEVIEPKFNPQDLKRQKSTRRFKIQSPSSPAVPADAERVANLSTLDSILNLSRESDGTQ